MKELAEDRMEQAEQAATPGLPRFAVARATLAERLEAAADKLGLTPEQRKQIAQTLAAQAEQHSALKAKCRDAIEDEFKAIAAVLTPEQQEMAREEIESRMLRAAAASSIADRLEAGADKLGLSADQRRQIAKASAQFAGKQRAMRSERRELLEEEWKGIAAVLTPEQRDKIKDYLRRPNCRGSGQDGDVPGPRCRSPASRRGRRGRSGVTGDDRRADRGHGRQARIDG